MTYICDIKNSRQGRDLPKSVNERVNSSICEGFNFHETSHMDMRSFAKKRLAKMSDFTVFTACESTHSEVSSLQGFIFCTQVAPKLVLWQTVKTQLKYCSTNSRIRTKLTFILLFRKKALYRPSSTNSDKECLADIQLDISDNNQQTLRVFSVVKYWQKYYSF